MHNIFLCKSTCMEAITFLCNLYLFDLKVLSCGVVLSLCGEVLSLCDKV